MRESRTYGSVRGALSNERPYRDPKAKPIISRRIRHEEAAARNKAALCHGGSISKRRRDGFRLRLNPSYRLPSKNKTTSPRIAQRHFQNSSGLRSINGLGEGLRAFLSG